MTDYNSKARTNYFRVRDVEALRNDLAAHGQNPLTPEPENWRYSDALILDDGADNKPEGAVALFCQNGWPVLDDEQFWLDNLSVTQACPAYIPLTEESRRAGDVALPDFPTGTSPCDRCRHVAADHTATGDYDSLHTMVAAHLIEGDVAVFMEVGSEKMRYLAGDTVAVNSAGDSRRVSLSDIYGAAKSLGATVTDASY